MSELIIDKIRGFLDDFLPTIGLTLFDIQFRVEGHGWILRVFIDNDKGVTLDHCSDVSRELGQYLDVEELIDHAYNLEVSSPGLERPLRSLDDFKRFFGKKAKLRTHEAIGGEKIFEGEIGPVNEEFVSLVLPDGVTQQFTIDMLSKARLVI